MFRKIGIFLLALLFFSGCTSVAGYDGCEDDELLKAYIRELCETYQIPEMLVFAVIEKESSWNADAVNYNETCFGLMQINTINFAWLEEELGLDNPKDPYQNVHAGIYMLSGYVEKYIDYHMALMCYNCGEAGARELWKDGIFTNAYSRWVIDRMHDLEWEALDAARDALFLQRQAENMTQMAEGETPVVSIEDMTLDGSLEEQIAPADEGILPAETVTGPEEADSLFILYAEDIVSVSVRDSEYRGVLKKEENQFQTQISPAPAAYQVCLEKETILCASVKPIRL